VQQPLDALIVFPSTAQLCRSCACWRSRSRWSFPAPKSVSIPRGQSVRQGLIGDFDEQQERGGIGWMTERDGQGITTVPKTKGSAGEGPIPSMLVRYLSP
jgi:hypothetical protein